MDMLLFQIVDGNMYVFNAALDAANLIAKASTQSIAAYCFLWDLAFKRSLVSLPFIGKLLFEAEFEKIIS